MNSRPPYFIFISWLWLAGLLLFGVIVVWHMGLLPEVLASDQTRISVVLLVLTGLVTLHCAYRGYRLARFEVELGAWKQTPSPQPLSLTKHRFSQNVRGRGAKADNTEDSASYEANMLSPPLPVRERGSGGEGVYNSLTTTYLQLIIGSNDKNLALNGELLSEHLHYQHAFGWFAAGAMIKLGLLGTVIGFIMMLTSISGLDSLEIEQVQQLMQQMTQGMMVALNTTLLGLVGSLILGVQYLFLDHCADRLLAQTLLWVQQCDQQVDTDTQQVEAA